MFDRAGTSGGPVMSAVPPQAEVHRLDFVAAVRREQDQALRPTRRHAGGRFLRSRSLRVRGDKADKGHKPRFMRLAP